VDARDGELVLWSPPGIPRLLPVDEDGAEIRVPQDEPWELGERLTVWEGLGFLHPDAHHSLWLHWDAERRFSHWYVNLERHVGRSARAIDYVDDKLDLVVAPDGSVRWKDEDELAHAAQLGLLDEAAVRAEARRVLADPPWPTGWEDWRPDPAWPAPVLPAHWDRV
jgi:hypothetical protein